MVAEETENPTDGTEDVETSPQAGTSSSQLAAWRKGLSRMVATKAFLIPLLAALAVSVLIWVFPVERFFQEDHRPTVTPLGRVVYDISSYLGYRHTVTFRLSASYIDSEEKVRLQEKLPTLKTVIANAGHLPEFQAAVQEKDLNALEKATLELIGDVTNLPVDRLRVSRLRLD